MSKQGWVSIHRSMIDHWLWEGEKFTKGQAWIDLVLHANHAKTKAQIKGRLLDIDRGQQIRSQVTLSNKWGWNPRTVKKFLVTLEAEGMIKINSTELTTFISICNYDSYQDINKKRTEHKAEHDNEQSAGQSSSKLPTGNNDNNANNENNGNKKSIAKKSSPKKEIDYTCWPYIPEQQIFDDWLAMRKTKKASVSQTVVNQFGKKLHAAVSLGYTVDECIAECVTRNWTGFEIEWMENSKKSNSGGFNKAQQVEDINRQVGEDWLNGR